jgi:hypothetical protein
MPFKRIFLFHFHKETKKFAKDLILCVTTFSIAHFLALEVASLIGKDYKEMSKEGIFTLN